MAIGRDWPNTEINNSSVTSSFDQVFFETFVHELPRTIKRLNHAIEARLLLDQLGVIPILPKFQSLSPLRIIRNFVDA